MKHELNQIKEMISQEIEVFFIVDLSLLEYANDDKRAHYFFLYSILRIKYHLDFFVLILFIL